MFSWDYKAPPPNLTTRYLWYLPYFLQMIIALLSSMAVKSRYCQDELALSYVSNKPIFPVAIQAPSELFPLMDTGMWVHDDVIEWKHFPRYWPFTGLCTGNSPGTGEFPVQRPVKRNFDVFFDPRLNKRLGKQSWGWWFETPSCPLWRHCNAQKPTKYRD